MQPVGHLLGDVGADFLHVGVALQITAADVQRNVGRIDDTMQQRQELGHDTLHLVGDEHLVAIELNLVALKFDVGMHAGEIQNARQVERIVHIQVNPEQRLVLHGIKRAVEALVVFVLQAGRGLYPQWLDGVDYIVLVCLNIFSILPLCLLAKDNRYSHELAVFV